jgi:hypothetical protein
MESKKINQLATEMSPAASDLTIIGDPITGVSKKITLEQISSLFAGSVSFYTNYASFPVTGVVDTIYCAKDTQKLYLWSGSAYVEVFPSQALLNTYQLRSEKGNANGYASLDSGGKVPVSQLPSSIMEYKGTWSAATNTPTLANGTGDTGDVYICNAAGSVNFGAGAITFAIGDYVIYSGSIWQRSSGAVGTVTSVAVTETGDALTITGSPITTSGTINIGFAGLSNQYVNGAGGLTTFPTLISSIGLSMPSAFNVANSPLTANGTIAVTGAGVASQYIRGDGTLATLPTGGGGGSSVSYYLNGSINQGTFGGNTYYEINKVPIIGAGTDFSRGSNGYIASFLTDANDPALLNIPAGNWNFETYFNASNGGGSPSFYIELYKYDGTTFTLIASNSATPKLINDGASIEAYYSALAVPQTSLTLTDRLAVRIYVNASGRTITLHTENGHLCQVITTFSTGLTALNGLTEQVQYFGTGTSGTDFNIASSVATHTFNLPVASAINTGKLSSSDWSVFNSKEPAITAGTTAQYYRGDKTFQTLNTTAVVEATNLYFTDARSRAALSFAAGSGAYNSTTGVITIPTNNNQITNGSNFITLTSLSGGTGISYNNTTGVITNSAPDQTVSLTNGAGISISGTYPSFTIASTITQYTDALARAALSFVAGSGAYNSTTGVITIPTNNNQITNGSNYITLTSLSGSTGISYNNTTGAISSTITQYTDALARAAISLTTTGTSGAATYNSTTGVFNIPNYAPDLSGYVPTSRTITINGTSFDLSANRTYSVGTVTSVGLSSATSGVTIGSTPITTSGTITLAIATASGSQNGLLSSTDWTTFNNKQSALTNPVTGTGTTNYLPKFTGASTIGNSALQEVSGNLGLGVTPSNWSNVKALQIGSTSVGGFSNTGYLNANAFFNATTNWTYVNSSFAARYELNSGDAGVHRWYTAPSGTAGNSISFTEAMTLNASGNLGLGVEPPAWSTFKAINIFGGSFSVNSAGGGVVIAQNWYFDGAEKYFGDGSAQRIELVGNGFFFQTAATNSSGSGAALTWTSPMTLAATGNLLINTTTDAGYKLDVNGTGKFANSVLIGTSNLPSWASGTENVLQIKNGAVYGYSNYESGLVANAYYNEGWKRISATTASMVLVSDVIQFRIAGSGAANSAITWMTPLSIANNGSSTFSGDIIYNNAGNQNAIITSGAANNGRMYIYSAGNADIGFQAGGSSWFLNRLGIGTNSPSVPLDVYNTSASVTNNPGNSQIRASASSTQWLSIGYDTTVNAGFLQAAESGIAWRPLILNNNGGDSSAILIGTSTGVSGGGKVQVNGNVNINGVFQINGTTIGGGGGSGVTGTGTTNYLTKWTGSTTLGNSGITDNGSTIRATTQFIQGSGDARSTSGTTVALNLAGAVYTANSDPGDGGRFFSIVNDSSATNAFSALSYRVNSGGGSNNAMLDVKFVNTNSQSGTLYWTFLTPGGFQDRMALNSAGNLLLGTNTDNGSRLQISGTSTFSGASVFSSTVTSSGGFFDTSDSRLKIIIKDYNKAKGIENVSARLYLKNNKVELGYYAQDVQKILPSAVGEGTDGFLTLSYSQVHTAKIAYLEDKIAQLEELIKTLL